MKKTILASAIIAAAAFNPQISQAASLETRQAGVATAGVLAGALAGGPVGMLARVYWHNLRYRTDGKQRGGQRFGKSLSQL